MAPKLTKREKHTQDVEARLKSHLQKDWHDLFEDEPFSPTNLSSVAECPPFEFWSYHLKGKDYDLYLIWDGKEVLSFDDLPHAISGLVYAIRETHTRERFLYFSSPLIISGALALGLFILIFALSFEPGGVPPQLWSVFTAVIAFYFGKEAWKSQHRSRTETAADE